MEVTFYGRLAERLGRQLEVTLPEDGCSVAELRGILASRYPEVAAEINSRRVRACVANAIVGDDTRVHGAQSVEFFPPVSGG